MAQDALIKAEHVSKKFCRSLKRSLWYGVKDMAREVVGGPDRHDELRQHEFWAVNDVSLEVRRGECLGLLGRNGAGKTTLLKILNGLIKPDRGSVEIHGRIGALIALGAGFNPLLSGRENIYINGAVLGLQKHEVAAKFDEIVEFADIGDFLDAPLQSYSSGMAVRLGFAVATALQPDVLLVDEVLAVGDTGFRVRCYNRIRDLLPRTAVILVSHSMYDIGRTCDRVVVMNSGAAAFQGAPYEGIPIYQDLAADRRGSTNGLLIHLDRVVSSIVVAEFTPETAGLETTIKGVVVLTCSHAIGPVRLRVIMNDDAGIGGAIAEWDSHIHGVNYELRSGGNSLPFTIQGIRLRSGSYRIAIVVSNLANVGYLALIEDGLRLRIDNECVDGAYYRI